MPLECILEFASEYTQVAPLRCLVVALVALEQHQEPVLRVDTRMGSSPIGSKHSRVCTRKLLTSSNNGWDTCMISGVPPIDPFLLILCVATYGTCYTRACLHVRGLRGKMLASVALVVKNLGNAGSDMSWYLAGIDLHAKIQ